MQGLHNTLSSAGRQSSASEDVVGHHAHHQVSSKMISPVSGPAPAWRDTPLPMVASRSRAYAAPEPAELHRKYGPGQVCRSSC